MGSGLANVLGGAAEGFEQARQQDLTRQFADEQNRRNLAADFLGKIAFDENAPPEMRNAALQSHLQLAQQDWKRPMDLKKIFDPVFQAHTQAQAAKTAAAQAPAPPVTQTFTPPPPLPTPPSPPSAAAGAPSGQMGPPSVQQAAAALPLRRPPAPPQAGQVQFTPPPGPTPPPVPPESMLGSPERTTQIAAARTAALTGAAAGAEMKTPIYTRNPDGTFTVVGMSGAGAQMQGGIPNAISPYMMQGRGLRQITYLDPTTGQPQPGVHNLFTGEVLDQQGHVVPGAVPFESSLLPSVSGESMAPSGAITRTRTPILRPPGGAPTPAGGGGRAPTAPAAPGGTGGAAKGAATKLPVTTADFQSIKDPVTREALDWATLGQKPTGGIMAERQVETRMNQLGLAKALPVPPALQRTIQEQFVARNSAIGLIDDIMANKSTFSSLLGGGKIAIASRPDGSGFVQRLMPLSDQEARVVGDFEQLVEHANLLRGPLGATGFRGAQAWGALQAQRGNPAGDPRITTQVMSGMRDRLVGLNSADKLVLTGGGMSGAAADPYEGHTATNPANKHQIKWTQGHWVDAKTGEPI